MGQYHDAIAREAYQSEDFEYLGQGFVAYYVTDYDHGTPWDEEDGHGPVTQWVRRDKAPGEMLLNQDGGSKRFYDFKEAVAIAKRDGWGPVEEGDTAGQTAARAALADFQRLKDWCDDRWHYCAVVVFMKDQDGNVCEDFSDALWGIESDAGGGFFSDVKSQLASEVLNQAAKAGGTTP